MIMQSVDLLLLLLPGILQTRYMPKATHETAYISKSSQMLLLEGSWERFVLGYGTEQSCNIQRQLSVLHFRCSSGHPGCCAEVV